MRGAKEPHVRYSAAYPTDAPAPQASGCLSEANPKGRKGPRVTEFCPELCVSVGNQFLNRRSESELRTAEIKAFSACFLVGMDVAMVHAKGTNDDRDECDK